MSESPRLRGERGTALVTAAVLLFALLARDYDERLATRSTAQAIAFQAARVGAQQVDVDALRGGGAVVLDSRTATERSRAAAHELLRDHGESGDVIVTIDGDRVTVVVEIVDVVDRGFASSRRTVVRAEGSARAGSG